MNSEDLVSLAYKHVQDNPDKAHPNKRVENSLICHIHREHMYLSPD